MIPEMKLILYILRKSKQLFKKMWKSHNETINYLITKYTSLQLHYVVGRSWLIGKARGWKVM